MHIKQEVESTSDVLLQLVHDAKQHVPYYRKAFALHDCSNILSFARLPFLDKGTISAEGRQMIDERMDIKTLVSETTSGSTGTPLIIYRSLSDSYCSGREIWARRMQVAPITSKDRYAKFYRFMFDDFTFSRIIQEKNFVALSLMNLNETGFQNFCQAILDYKPKWFFAVPSAIYALATYLERSGYMDGEKLGFEYIELSGEYVFNHQMELIKQVFQCPVINHYGTRETWAIATSCNRGSLHICDQNVYVELIDQSGRQIESLQDDVEGEVVLTALHNRAMPLIRYRVGDMAKWKQCRCGSASPALHILGGRTSEVVKTPNGELSSMIFYHVTEQINANHQKIFLSFQAVQTKLNEFILRVVPSTSFNLIEIEKELKQLLSRHLVHPFEISLEVCEQIQPSASGKWKYFLSEL